jgi:hypothetical protein
MGFRFEITEDGILKKAIRNDGRRGKTVVKVPEGVIAIGKHSMRGIICRKLVMPSTLIRIEEGGLCDAHIDEIDFGGCRLQRIESGAFSGCHAKAKLPDTVNFMGAAIDLNISEGSKLRLPASLRYIDLYSLSLEDFTDLEVDEAMMTGMSNLERFININMLCRKWITVHVLREGKEMYRFVQSGLGNVTYDIKPVKHFIVNGLNYERYDKCFDEAMPASCKAHLAFYRLMWPNDLPAETEKKYRLFVRAHFRYLIIGKEEDIEAIRLLNQLDLITDYRRNQLLENATKRGNIEVAALLVEMFKKKSAAKTKSLEL